MKHRTYSPDGTLISEEDVPDLPTPPDQELRAEITALKADIRDATSLSDLKARVASRS